MNRTWRGRCRFVEFLKCIMLNIFIENKRIRLCICINVEHLHLCIFPEFFIRFSDAYESWHTRYRMNNVRIRQCGNRKSHKIAWCFFIESITMFKFLYKTLGISSKGHTLANSVYDRIGASKSSGEELHNINCRKFN